MSIWVLIVCPSITLGMCSARHTYEYVTEARCMQAKTEFLRESALKPAIIVCEPKRADK